MQETKERHSKMPISQDQYDNWLRDPVTVRLFEELDLSRIEQALESVDGHTPEELAIQAATLSGCMFTIEQVLNWSPAGCMNAEQKEEARDENN